MNAFQHKNACQNSDKIFSKIVSMFINKYVNHILEKIFFVATASYYYIIQHYTGYFTLCSFQTRFSYEFYYVLLIQRNYTSLISRGRISTERIVSYCLISLISSYRHYFVNISKIMQLVCV